MNIKMTHPCDVKATGDGDSGEFTAIVSVFTSPDKVDDVVVPGAYGDTIKAWETMAKDGAPLPVIWSHDWANPESHIGYAKELRELEPGDDLLPDALKDVGGLWALGQLDIEDPEEVRARKAWRLIKGRRVKNWSFAYDVKAFEHGKTDEGRKVTFLKQLDVHEIGPTLMGAHGDTTTLTAKAAGFPEQLTAEELAIVRDIISEKQATAGDPDEKSQSQSPRLDPFAVLANTRARLLN